MPRETLTVDGNFTPPKLIDLTPYQQVATAAHLACESVRRLERDAPTSTLGVLTAEALVCARKLEGTTACLLDLAAAELERQRARARERGTK